MPFQVGILSFPTPKIKWKSRFFTSGFPLFHLSIGIAPPPPPRTREDRASEPQTPQMLRSRPNCRHLPLRGRQSVLLAVADALLRLRGRFPIAARAASAGWPPNAVSAERSEGIAEGVARVPSDDNRNRTQSLRPLRHLPYSTTRWIGTISVSVTSSPST